MMVVKYIPFHQPISECHDRIDLPCNFISININGSGTESAAILICISIHHAVPESVSFLRYALHILEVPLKGASSWNIRHKALQS